LILFTGIFDALSFNSENCCCAGTHHASLLFRLAATSSLSLVAYSPVTYARLLGAEVQSLEGTTRAAARCRALRFEDAPVDADASGAGLTSHL